MPGGKKPLNSFYSFVKKIFSSKQSETIESTREKPSTEKRTGFINFLKKFFSRDKTKDNPQQKENLQEKNEEFDIEKWKKYGENLDKQRKQDQQKIQGTYQKLNATHQNTNKLMANIASTINDESKQKFLKGAQQKQDAQTRGKAEIRKATQERLERQRRMMGPSKGR